MRWSTSAVPWAGRSWSWYDVVVVDDEVVVVDDEVVVVDDVVVVDEVVVVASTGRGRTSGPVVNCGR